MSDGPDCDERTDHVPHHVWTTGTASVLNLIPTWWWVVIS